MGKRGILSFNFVSMIPRILFLVIVLTVVIILVEIYMNQKFNTEDMRAEILINGFIYATGGVTYYEPIAGRSYPEIIDIMQMNGTELDDTFYFKDNNIIAAKIFISEVPGSDGSALKEVYYNKEWYDSWEPLSKLKLGGIGGVSEYKRTFPTIYRRPDGTMKSMYVTFRVLQPK